VLTNHPDQSYQSLRSRGSAFAVSRGLPRAYPNETETRSGDADGRRGCVGDMALASRCGDRN